jgi:hypothetical protein
MNCSCGFLRDCLSPCDARSNSGKESHMSVLLAADFSRSAAIDERRLATLRHAPGSAAAVEPWR